MSEEVAIGSQTDQSGPAAQTSLAADFPSVSEAQWEDLVRAKARDANAPLSTELEDGLTVKWLYSAQDSADEPAGLPGEPPFVRGTRLGTRWQVRQDNAGKTLTLANAQILEELEGGATELLLRIDPAGLRGIPVSSVDDLDQVLTGVHLEMVAIALGNGAVSPQTALQSAAALTQLWTRRQHDPAEIRGSLRLAPIAAVQSDEAAVTATMQAFAQLRQEFPNIQVLGVDTGVYVNAGAGAREELAIALATAIAYLRAGETAAISPAEVAAGLEFTLIAGPDQFLEIAKFRAIRKLWSKALEHCGAAPESQCSRVYARTSRRMTSSLDPWVNLLRSTTAAFAAGVGGADGITVLPFDEAFAETVVPPGPLGLRMARNTQLVLLEEANLYRVADPAGGSWYVEALTDQLASSAWERLQEIEAAGGISAVLASGEIAGRLARATANRQKQIATRERELTGVNTFPLLGEDGLERAAPAADEQAKLNGSSDTGAHQALSGPAFKLVRDGAQFEHLRARSITLAQQRGQAPKLLLACMGPLSAHVAINQWAKSFFEAGGIETISSGPQPDNASQSALLREHELTVAAVCPGRSVSAEDQHALVSALRRAGADRIYLVGAGDDDAAAAGADSGVRSGVDLVTVLGGLLDHFEEASP